MDRYSSVKSLKVFNKWLRGKGKKYVGSYIDVSSVGEAIKFAVDVLSHIPSNTDFSALYNMAVEDAAYRKQNHEVVTDLHKSAIRSFRKYVNRINTDKDA